MLDWDKGDVLERVKMLWEEGNPASYIAQLIGPNVTKNAIIGKMNRLKIASGKPKKRVLETAPSRSSGQSSSSFQRYQAEITARRKAGAQKRTEAQRVKTAAQQHAEKELVQQALATTIIVPENERRDVLTRTYEQCHWPIGHPGEAGFHYCHLPHEAGMPYCSVHIYHAYTRLPNT